MYVVGIDPGISGAIIIILTPTDAVVDHTMMPIITTGTKKAVDGNALADWLKPYMVIDDSLFAVVEAVHSMPKQGVTSSFNFGHSFGVVEGVLGALSIPYGLVTPQRWKKEFGFISKDKDEPRGRLLKLKPEWKEIKAKGKGQALADAYYIAKSHILVR